MSFYKVFSSRLDIFSLLKSDLFLTELIFHVVILSRDLLFTGNILDPLKDFRI